MGLVALTTANAKAALTFVPALTLGIMCNALVCLAVWMCYGARTTIDRVVAIIPPISAFAAAGFRALRRQYVLHSDRAFHQSGRIGSFWSAIGKTASDFPALTWYNFLVGNLFR